MGSLRGNLRICVMLAAVACALALPIRGLDPNKTISQFTHTSWSAKDGIPGPVQAIAQTPDGYLWLGTRAGLYRFDGLRFISWEAACGGDPLPQSSIMSLFTARDGSLWMGFGAGVVARLRDGVLRTYSAADGSLRTTRSFAEDGGGSIWAGGENGLSRFENGRWHRVGAALGYRAAGAQQLVVDRRGTLWVATTGTDFGLSGDSVSINTILTLAPNGKQFQATGQPVAYISQLAEAPDGQIWMFQFGEQAVRPVLGRAERNVSRAVKGPPMCGIFDGESSLWIGLFRGGIRRAPDFKHLEHASFDRFESADGLSSDSVRAAFRDREGNIWFGTNRGLDRFRENKATPFSAKEGLAQNPLLDLTSTPDGTVWVITFAGDRVQHFVGGRIVSQRLPAHSGSDSILSLYSDKDRVWLGGSFGLAEGIGGKFSFVSVPGNAEKSGVENITSDSSGNLWIVVFEGNKSRVRRLRNGAWTDFSDSPELPNYRCGALFGDAAGRVWLGFDGEVAVYENDRFHRYSAADGLPHGRVRSIASDHGGRVWFGSEGGLSRFDGRRFATLTKENGIPGNAVSGIVEDDDGFYWIAGALGIIRASLQEVEKALKSSTYRMQTLFLDTTDGLPGLPNPASFPAAIKTPDGKLWFATTDGIAVVDPRRLPMNAVPPTILIQTVTADNRPFAISSELHLRPKVRNVEIGFAALSLSIPERVLFRYKLEGYDDEWRGPVTDRSASYTNLPPRDYRFRVIACNNDGVWNETGATLAFSIDPAFYQTDSFRLFCLAAAAGILLAAIRWRLRLMAARLAAQFQQRLEERTRIAQDLHDTLLQGFISASLQLSVANRELTADSKAKPIVSEVLELMRTVIEEGRSAVRGMRLTQADTNDLEKSFSRIRVETLAERPVDFRVLVEGPEQPLHALVRDDVYRIGREAIINAFRHSGAANVEVELRYSDRNLRLFVRDDGRGIEPQILRDGRDGHWGLSGMRETAERIGAKLRLQSRLSEGTEVELTVPAEIAFAAPPRPPARRPWRIFRRRSRSNEQFKNSP
jgi:signal transduction histidine kinase/ligand-binding sensor domain-containing protein